MQVFEGNETYTFYPILEPTHENKVVAHTVESHDAKVSLNTDNSVDKSHLYLEGPLGLDEFFIRCYDPEQDTGSGLPEENEFYVDRSGNVNCKALYSETTSDITNSISGIGISLDTIEETLNNGTENATPDTFVVRDNAGGAKFGKLTTDSLVLNSDAVGPHISMPRNSILHFVPYLADGVTPRPDSVYRFGRNHEELEASGAGDGLEFIQDNEEILIQVQPTAPTIRIGMDKDAGVNVLEVFHGVGNLVFAIHPDGSLFQAHLTETNEANIHDNEGHSSVHGGSSVFVGNMRISYVNGQERFEYINAIPAVLAAPPYNIVTGQLSKAASLYSVRDWLVLARNTVSDYTIKARNIFTDPTDWAPLGIDFAKSLTEDPQAFIDQASTDIAQAQTDITTLQNASGGTNLEILNTTGSAFIKITTNTDVADASAGLILRAEASSVTSDREYSLITDPSEGDQLILTCDTATNGLKQGFAFSPAGHVGFACGGNAMDLNQSPFQVRRGAWFRDTLKVSKACTFLESVDIGVAGDSKQLTLNGVQITASPAPTFHNWINFNKPATGYQLGAGSHIVHVGDGRAGEKSVTYYITLPASSTAVVGDYIEVRCMAQIHLQLETENTSVLYAAVFDSISNNKSITYSCFNGDSHGIITYVQHQQSTSQYSWVSTTGALY